jgi:hypothetical protein
MAACLKTSQSRKPIKAIFPSTYPLSPCEVKKLLSCLCVYIPLCIYGNRFAVSGIFLICGNLERDCVCATLLNVHNEKQTQKKAY